MPTIREMTEVCDTINSLAINGSNESTGVTTFVQEACTAVEAIGKHYVGSELLVTDTEAQDLKEYFRRPRLVTTGTFPTGSTYNRFTDDINASKLFGATYFPNGLTRLAGVQGVRFRLVFTLQVAATPFTQGVVCLNWQYSEAPGERAYKRNLVSATSTHIPHVRLDLSADTMCQLSIPFLHPFEYTELNFSQEYGTIGLNVILRIPSLASAPPPTYKLYVHLEDLVLIGAMPQDLTQTVVLQSGRKKPIDQEFENDAYPVSSSLHAASRSFSWIAKGIPMLSSLASTPAWFLDKAAGVARSFGFSKPQIRDPVIRMVNLGSVAEHNIDCPSSTVMLSGFAGNTLKVDGSFAGTDVDEMALSYVMSQWSQVNRFLLEAVNPTNTVLYAAPVSPSSMWFRVGSGPSCNVNPPVLATGGATKASAFLPSNLFYFASLFRYWKGSMKFRFTFAKTKFHSGRVMVSYIPYTRPPVAAADSGFGSVIIPDNQNGGLNPFGYTAIFDLKDSNVFEFEVPYVSPTPWTDFFSATGSITVCVTDPLQAPASVAPNVDTLVEVCAGSDFELALPVGPMYPTVIPINESNIRFQSGKISKTINNDASQYTIGESYTSLKQLIMIPKVSSLGVTLANTIGTVLVMPWWYKPAFVATDAGTGTCPAEAFSFGGYISAAFNYVRGSTDVHVYTNDYQTNSTLIWANLCSNKFNAASNTNTPNNRTGVNLPRVWAPRGSSLHIRVPNYSRVARVPSSTLSFVTWIPNVASGFSNPALPSTVYGPDSMARVRIQNIGTGTAAAFMNRAAGDDAMLGHFMGASPLNLNISSAGATWDPDTVGFN